MDILKAAERRSNQLKVEESKKVVPTDNQQTLQPIAMGAGMAAAACIWALPPVRRQLDRLSLSLAKRLTGETAPASSWKEQNWQTRTIRLVVHGTALALLETAGFITGALVGRQVGQRLFPTAPAAKVGRNKDVL